MIDVHCHVLPGIDDGPPDLGSSVGLAAASAAAGTTVLVATPHIDRHWGVEPLEVEQRVVALREELKRAGVELELRTGGEVDIARLAELDEEQIKAVRLGGGPYLLLESPLGNSTWDFDSILLVLLGRGERILLAHPERCTLFRREPRRLERLIDAGILCSITAGSMWGQFGERVRRFTIEMLEAEFVHDVASDSHDVARRPPGYTEAFAAAEQHLPGISRQAEWLTVLAPAAILAGEPLPERPARNYAASP